MPDEHAAYVMEWTLNRESCKCISVMFAEKTLLRFANNDDVSLCHSVCARIMTKHITIHYQLYKG